MPYHDPVTVWRAAILPGLLAILLCGCGSTVSNSPLSAPSPSPSAAPSSPPPIPPPDPGLILWQQQDAAFTKKFNDAGASAVHDQTDTINAINDSTTAADRSDYWSLLADVYATYLTRVGPLKAPGGYEADFAAIIKQAQGLERACKDISAHGGTAAKVGAYDLGRVTWEGMIDKLGTKISEDPRHK